MTVANPRLRRSLHFSVSSGALAAGLSLMASPARADCQLEFSIPNIIFVCSGSNTTTQAVSNAGITDVRTVAGFSVDTMTTGGNALDIQGLGRILYRDTFASPLTSPDAALSVWSTGDAGFLGSIGVETNGDITGRTGILATNAGSGAVEITSTGNILGTSGPGIQATGSGMGMTINVANVTSTGSAFAGFGIYAQNGGGGTNVFASGDVVSAAGTGIAIINDVTASEAFVSVNNVTGGTNGIRILNNGMFGTAVVATGAVAGTNGTGIFVESNVNGPGAAVTIAAVDVTGGVDGIRILNNGQGSFSPARTVIATTGDVIGGSGDGIGVANGAATTDLDITAVNVTGGNLGIVARNDGTGRTRIVATGRVSGGIVGITASNGTSTTDLTVEAVDVTGGQRGIFAANFGTGTTRVTSTGTVASTAAGGSGILVANGANGSDVSVAVADITGWDGIIVQNFGTGATVVTSTGNIVGTDGNFGLFATNAASATDLTVNVATVSHRRLQAIVVANEGSGATRITATGNVISGGGAGISARNGTTATDLRIDAVDVTGVVTGIFAGNQGTGGTRVAATGRVTATAGTGILAVHLGGAAGLTVNAAGVSGGTNGIDARNTGGGATRVTAGGEVRGGTGFGLSVSTGGSATDIAINVVDIAGGGLFGISSFNGGSGATAITATGAVLSATGAGIAAHNTASTTNLTIEAATATGASVGIRATNEGVGLTSVTATGLVQGNSYGIDARNAVTTTNLIVNAAAVTGRLGGIAAQNDGSGATAVTATGAVAASAGTGIFANHSAGAGGLTIDATVVSGDAHGIDARNTGGGATRVTATGEVRGGAGGGLSVTTAGSATDITINAVDVAGGGSFGVSSLNGGSGSTAIRTTGTVSSATGDGIAARNIFSTTNLTIQAATVTGADVGIRATNEGVGLTSVTATGPVQGNVYGIDAQNAATATNLTLNVATVTGRLAGIVTRNAGSGDTTITAAGAVTASAGTGILADHTAGAGGLTIDATVVSGGAHGIDAHNTGGGATRVAARGDVLGGIGTGIFANHEGGAAGLTVDAAGVSGGTNGIDARNTGGGATRVTATGQVRGGTGIGLSVTTEGSATDTTISAVDVAGGGSFGLRSYNGGSGSTAIVATGAVSSAMGDGIAARNISSTTNLTIDAATVTAAGTGIRTINEGAGLTSVIAAGPVQGGFAGIWVANGTATTSLTVNAAAVSGGTYGILAVNGGTDITSVTATGNAVGGQAYGIVAVNGSVTLGVDGSVSNVAGNNGTSLSVDAVGASGGFAGIYAVNAGTGQTTVRASGVVQGGANAVFATANNQAVDLQFAPTAVVRNTSLLSSALAVSASGSSVTLANSGQLAGAVQLTGLNNQVTNGGTWSTAGAVSSLGGPTSQLTNSVTGTILAASSGGTLETTQFQGTGNFLNRGVVTLRDGGAGDVVRFGGNATFAATSVQAIDLGNGMADRVVVDGVVNLSGTLAVTKTGGSFQLGGRYPVLTAAGGLNGRYSALTGDVGQLSTFFSVVDAYDANNAYLEVAQQRPFSAVAFTPNQTAAANGAQSLPIGNPLFNAIATLQTDAQARVAFDQISGEAHASGRTALNEGSRMVRDAALGRLRNAFGGPAVSPGPATAQVGSTVDDCSVETCQASADPTVASRYAVWAQGLGSWGSTDGNGNAAGLFRSNAGFLVGADAQLFDVGRLGLFGGYTRTTFNVADRQSSGGSDNAHLGLYGGAQFGPIGVRLGAAYSWHTLSATRGVAFPGFADTLRSDYAARTVQVFGELGYRIPVNKVTFEPFANVAYSNLSTDGFTEKGGAAALSVAGSSTNVTTTTLGLRIAYSFQLGDAPSQLRGMLGWQHAFGDVTPLANMVLNGGSPFTVSGIPIAQNSALIEAGFDVRLSERVSLGATYTGQFASGVQDQAVRASITLNF